MNEEAAASIEPAAPAAPVDSGAAAADPVAPAANNDDQEWDSAYDEMFPGIRAAKKENKDEPTKPKEGTQAKGAQGADTNNQKPDAKQGDDNDAGEAGEGAEGEGEAEEEAEQPDFTARDARVAARQSAQELEVMKNDVREKLFPNSTRELLDKNGEAIRTIEDVMQRINPATITAENPQGRTFTEEEAGLWLLHAQQKLNEQIAQDDKEIDRIADVNLSIKDEADAVKYEYGNLIAEMLKTPEGKKILQGISDDFDKTLQRDAKTGVPTAMPLSLKSFYDRAFAPYIAQARAQEENQPPAKTEAEIKAEAETEQARRQQARADRSDIFGGSQPDNRSAEDKEWADAAKSYFGK